MITTLLPRGGRRLLMALAFACVTPPLAAHAEERVCTIPSGTKVLFHTTAPISSATSKSDTDFDFVVTAPVGSGDCAIPAGGTKGVGTIVLAGKAGIHGHEGDLTLTLDTLRTADGRLVTFDDQVLEINGGNHKVEAGALNLVPDVGIAANFVRGKDITIEPSTPVSTTLIHDAYVTRGDPTPAP